MPPAARIGDMHVCPMVTPGTPPIPHVGGPISVGFPTVMIGEIGMGSPVVVTPLEPALPDAAVQIATQVAALVAAAISGAALVPT